jgi:DNA-binding IclR family transcriptional regulator
MARALKPELTEFLDRHFESRAALEVLLRVARSAEGCTVDDLAGPLGLTTDQIMDIVVALQWQGLMASDAAGRWRLAPQTGTLARRVAELLAEPLPRLLRAIEAKTPPGRNRRGGGR